MCGLESTGFLRMRAMYPGSTPDWRSPPPPPHTLSGPRFYPPTGLHRPFVSPPHSIVQHQIFMHKSAMQMHARDAVVAHRSEVKPHQCQQCLKSFSSNHQLVQHIRVHTGEKPYKCSYCDRRFKQLSHVQQHTRLHTGEYLKHTQIKSA
ncbi:Zinc finger protein 362 [Blattella germanica]|nr:Zinc finger protein 362 [Blattella germanica]